MKLLLAGAWRGCRMDGGYHPEHHVIPCVRPSLFVCFALLGAAIGGNEAAFGAMPARPNFKSDLPDDLELVIAAAPPLVTFPIMGCFDDRGRLFVGDAAGPNLRRKELEEKLPNRVLMLEDTDRDGVFDKVSMFADKMTFPQGACWLDGSLYVASPPGIWKLTDTNGDGIADRREMIVGGYDYDGNAADVHGPFLHPTNGRLYWCHGRKGHKVVQKDGTLVHEGKASGIWSCRPDGGDVQWHALGCMDNPVEVDFTAEGRIVGVVNIYYNQPRGDTLMHWLYGGAYERPDLLNVIAELPRTLEKMPVVHNFGHVAVSGFTRYRSGALNPTWRDNLFVTFFNTQKLVRVEMTPVGATYQATEHEFLKLNDPDAHFTDVIEDADGSLLVLNTGGWFRIGCPSSIAEKPDFRGAIYRVQKKNRAAMAAMAKARVPAAIAPIESAAVTPKQLLDATNPFGRLNSLEAIALGKRNAPAQRAALLKMLGEPLEPTLEHAAMFTAIATRAFDLGALRDAATPTLIRRLLVVLERAANDSATKDALLGIARKQLDAPDAALARTAVAVASRHPRALELCAEDLNAQLGGAAVSAGTLGLIAEIAGAQLAKPEAQKLIATMLRHGTPEVRRTAWRILAEQPGHVSHPDWLAPLAQSLAAASAGPGGGDLPLILDAIAKLATKHFDRALQALINDAARPLPIRLRALAAASRPGDALSVDAFALLLDVSKNGTSPTARVDAARFLSRAKLTKEHCIALAPVLPTAGPVELGELLKVGRRLEPATALLWAEQIVRSPVFGSVQESGIRTAFSNLTPATYERVLGPAARAAAAAQDEKKRKLEALAAGADAGRAGEGRKVFETSGCVACHKAAELGRMMGPDLSHIGQIRKPRDLLESIFFPNATIARDFETHVVETSDGQSYTGAIRGDAAAGLTLVDLAGQETIIPHARIVGRTTLATSLMPAGLELTFSDQQLLDLVAWLVSLK
ncbi:MAG: c-type cytochrome [Opitutus sp.]|nr:c-type cytochrome [Opitutus sp.]